MKLPRTHKLSFGNRFGGLWGESNNRGFLFGRDPFDNLWKRTSKPLVNLRKNKKCYELELALPGYSKDQISIHINDRTLFINGKKEEDKKNLSECIVKEHDIDRFQRSFQLGTGTSQDNISAFFKNGALLIKLYPIEKMETTPNSEVIKIN